MAKPPISNISTTVPKTEDNYGMVMEFKPEDYKTSQYITSGTDRPSLKSLCVYSL